MTPPPEPGHLRDDVSPVVFVGAGPGDPELMTRRGRDELAAATVVVADRPSLDLIVTAFAPQAEPVLVGRTRGQAAWTTESIVDLLSERHGAGARVVRLKSGDLFVCSRAAEEIGALRDRGVPVAVVPGVSAAIAAPLAAGVALVDGTGPFTVVAGNDDPRYPPIDWATIGACGGPVVVLMGRAHQGAIAERLLAAGRAPSTPVAVVHGASRDDEVIVRTTLAEVGTTRVPAPATLVIGGAHAHP